MVYPKISNLKNRQMGFKNRRMGFTLIEALVAMAVSSIGALLAVSLWLGFFNSIWNRSEGHMAQQQQLLITESMAAKISQSCKWISVDEDSLHWIDCQGHSQSLARHWESGLKILVNPLELDRNYNGQIDFRELSQMKELILILEFPNQKREMVRWTLRSSPL